MPSGKVKILYSHGGRILPLPPNRLSYVGGQTKLLSLDRRSATLPLLLSLLPSPSPPSFSLKYQLPGLDLDSLISLVDHHDFLHMLYEYDFACSSPHSTNKSPRLRLFLFPVFTKAAPSVSSVNPDYLFGLNDVSGAGNSSGSDTCPIDEGGQSFEDLISARPLLAMVPEPVRATVPVQTATGYYQRTTTQPMTGPIRNTYYALPAAPVGYYEGGRYQSVQLKTMAADGGYQYHPPQLIGYDGSGTQRLYYVLPQQGYQIGVEPTGGLLGSEVKDVVTLASLPQAPAV